MPSKNKKAQEEVQKEIKDEFFFNVPNTLTLARLLLVFLVVYMLFSRYSRLSVAIVFSIAALTDYFDGFFARRLKQTTKIGGRLDQVIDRIFTAITVIALAAYFLIYNSGEILYLFLISSREIIGLPGLIIRIILNKDSYKVRWIGKITTFIQSVTLALIIFGFPYEIYLVIITCLVGVVSGFDYLRDSF